MNIYKARDLLNSLKSIKTAQFYQVNSYSIAFKTEFRNTIIDRVIDTYPLYNINEKFTNELNEAIKPVLEKYIKIYEEEIRKCLDDSNEK